MDNLSLNILKLCYDEVIDVNSNIAFVKKYNDPTYRIVDKAGNMLYNKTQISSIINTGKLIFYKRPFGDYKLLEIHDDFKYDYIDDSDEYNDRKKHTTYFSVKPLKCGAVLLEFSVYWGIMGSNGEMLTPFIYNWAKVLDDRPDEATVYVGYSTRYHSNTICGIKQGCAIKIQNEGLAINHLLVINFDEDAVHQISVEDWSKDSTFQDGYGLSKSTWIDQLEIEGAYFKFKMRPAYRGCTIGSKLYDTVFLDKKTMDLGYYLVGNEYSRVEANDRIIVSYHCGVVGIDGIELIKPDKYINCIYMGNKIFLGVYESGMMELVVDGKVVQHKCFVVSYNPNNRIPIVDVTLSDGSRKYLGNDNKLHGNLMDAIKIYKYYKDGKLVDINKVQMYGSTYIVYNDFSLVDIETCKKLDNSEDSWCPIN